LLQVWFFKINPTLAILGQKADLHKQIIVPVFLM